MTKIQTLEQICKGDAFSIQVLGTYYCSLKPCNDKVKCEYRVNVADNNGLYICDAAMSKYNLVNKQ